jgi:hypothetical protein
MLLKNITNTYFLFFLSLCNIFSLQATTSNPFKEILTIQYEINCNTPSDINEHIPLLKKLSSECSTVVEIGLRSVVSTWGLLEGLAESSSKKKTYVGIDLCAPIQAKLDMAKCLAENNKIEFNFIEENSMYAEIDQTDLLFIDSLHTYAHLTYELERYSGRVTKYIAMHDTSAPWGDMDDSLYYGNYSEYPKYIDKTKRGLWPAVVDFLARHPEWKLEARHENCHGFTILKRV